VPVEREQFSLSGFNGGLLLKAAALSGAETGLGGSAAAESLGCSPMSWAMAAVERGFEFESVLDSSP
jgi:hypothetical protein